MQNRCCFVIPYGTRLRWSLVRNSSIADCSVCNSEAAGARLSVFVDAPLARVGERLGLAQGQLPVEIDHAGKRGRKMA